MMLLLGKYVFILINNPSPLCIRKKTPWTRVVD
jgi:hypothetical protein